MKFRSSAGALALAIAMCAVAPASAQQRGPVGRFIVFGDSLSDAGYYRNLVPGASRFTTNPDLTAAELVAISLGLRADTNYGQGGTNYATGGARVTAANAASIPITTQINNYLAAGGTFGENDLVFLQGGGNDFFFFEATGGTNNAILTTAATELAQQAARVQAAGAGRIVTTNIPVAGRPGFALFNQSYAAALQAANVNALYFDANRLFNEIVASPGSFGITNLTSTACTTSSSLTCTPATYREPNANRTYLFADSVHPSGIGHILQADAITSLLRAPDQIGQLSQSAQSIGRTQAEVVEASMGSAGEEQTGVRLFGNLGFSRFTSEGSAQLVGVDEQTLMGHAGVDFALGGGTGVGVAGGYSSGEGDFDNGLGGYDVRAWSATAYGRAGIGPMNALVSVSYSSFDYNDITRNLTLGPALRRHSGSTDGTYLGIAGSLSYLTEVRPGLRFGPEVGVSYDRVEIDGYSESGTQSTSIVFGNQELDSLTGRVGLAAQGSITERMRFSLRGSYEHDFNDDDQQFTITPAGAPISYTSRLSGSDSSYGSYAANIEGDLGAGVTLRAGVRGYVARRDFDTITGYAGLSIGF
jgi:outer membrane lipase/esterase